MVTSVENQIGESVLSTVEYMVIKKKLINQLGALGDNIKGLILYGSIAKGDGFYIPGESDIDFYLIVGNENILETYEKIANVVGQFRSEPLFAPLLDLRVVEDEEVKPEHYDALGILMARGASQGEVLIGENPLKDVEFPDSVIKQAARALIYISYTGYTDILTGGHDLKSHDIALVGVEHVITCAHAYLAYEGDTERVRFEMPEIYEEKYIDQFEVNTILEAHRYRLGIPKMEPDVFIPQAFNFCKAIRSQTSK